MDPKMDLKWIWNGPAWTWNRPEMEWTWNGPEIVLEKIYFCLDSLFINIRYLDRIKRNSGLNILLKFPQENVIIYFIWQIMIWNLLRCKSEIIWIFLHLQERWTFGPFAESSGLINSVVVNSVVVLCVVAEGGKWSVEIGDEDEVISDPAVIKLISCEWKKSSL